MRLVDVEGMVRAFLMPAVAPSKVHTAVPSTRPEKFVRIFRTGGAAENRVLERAQVTVQAWAEDTVSASGLAIDCRMHLLENYTLMPLVRSVTETGGLYFNPDPDTGIPRYQFTVELRVRAAR